MNRVLMTGGSRGIGAATARLLREAGDEVLAPTRQECNLSEWRGAQAYATGIPPCEGLILNAHTWYSRPLAEQQGRDFEAQYTYVIAHWMLLATLLAQGSLRSVVGVASTRGVIGGVATAPYSMAKAALIAMMQGFAREYAGVRFNTICPGLTQTDMEQEVRETGGCAVDAIAQEASFVAGQIVRVLHDVTANGQVWRVNAAKAERMQWGVL